MSSTLQALLFASALSVAPEQISAQTVHVRVYDFPEMPAATLRLATVEATRIFKSAGISLTWEQPTTEAPEDRGINMSTRDSRRVDQRPYVVVRILPGTAAGELRNALGFSLPFAQTGAHVILFYGRTDVIALSLGLASYLVLGQAMAHELGHVLLRSPEHSPVGLMQACWTAGTWRLASAGLVSFLPEQAKQMRTRLLQMHEQMTKDGRVAAVRQLAETHSPQTPR